MAFLSAGHVPGEGPYSETVEKGIRWVLAQQQKSGLFGGSGLEMYHQGICTLMLAEVAGMTDAKLGRKVKEAVENGVKVILQAQNRSKKRFSGGWRYSVNATDADLSVSGWQILALRAAKNLGCDIPAKNIDHALSFVKRCRQPRGGGFQYQPGGQVTPACTGTGILALELCQKHHTNEALVAGAYLLKNTGLSPVRTETSHFYYSAYYCSQAMFQLGGNYWNSYRPKLFKRLLEDQNRNGSWIGRPGLGASYSTSMSVLALTVEYRLLPIYQRGSDD